MMISTLIAVILISAVAVSDAQREAVQLGLISAHRHNQFRVAAIENVLGGMQAEGATAAKNHPALTHHRSPS